MDFNPHGSQISPGRSTTSSIFSLVGYLILGFASSTYRDRRSVAK